VIRFWPYEYRAAMILAVAALSAACLPPPGNARGVPLYPNGATARQPLEVVAQIVGPIAKIDGQEVGERGGQFELLPGCHIVELDRRIPMDNYALSNATYATGTLPITIYAIRMKPGAHYVIQRRMSETGTSQMARITLSAREETASGAVNELAPASSAQDIQACKQ
jgi:hypothetical protein